MRDSTALLTTKFGAHFFGQLLHFPGHVDGVADDGEFHPLRRTDVADNDRAVVEGDADIQFRQTFRAPFEIEPRQFLAHGEGGADGGDRILARPGAADVAPDGHDGVAHEFIERAAKPKNALDHGAEIFVQLPNEHVRIARGADFGVTADVGKKDRDPLAHAAERLLEELGVIEHLAHEIARNIALEGLADASFLHALEGEIGRQPEEKGGVELKAGRGHGQKNRGVIKNVERQTRPARIDRDERENPEPG